MFKKILSFLICLTMVLSFVPAMAEEASTDATEVSLTNVALNKPITAGIYDEEYQKKTELNDGDETTGIAYDASQPAKLKTDNPDGIPSNKTNAWFQIDLDGQYLIDHIVLKWNNKPDTFWANGYEFEIQASNSPEFTADTYTTLGVGGVATSVSNPFNVQGDGNYYRYVRFQKIPGMNLGYSEYSELEVWADESTAIYPPKPVNVALNKSITAGAYDKHNYPKERLNDGNVETSVNYSTATSDNADGVASGKTDAWFQIDLGARYQLENVTLIFNSWTTGADFKISVSNSSDFSDGTAKVIATEGDAKILQSPYVAKADDGYYRYVRWERIDGAISRNNGYENFQEIEVYAYEDTAILPANVALNKSITAGAYDKHNYPKERLNDGNVETSVNYSTATSDNAGGAASGKTDAWFQIDLGAKYQLENVTLIFNSWTTGADFKISVSNSSDFLDGTAKVIATEGDSKILSSPYVAKADGGYYRYVRWERVDGAISRNNGYENFQEIEVYAYEDTAIKPTNIAVNKSITAGVYQDKGDAMKKSWLNDGDKTTVLDYTASPDAETDNADGKVSSKTDAWYQIDLGARYLVEKIQLWYNTSDADYVIPYNFNILVSNSPDFSDGNTVVLKAVGDEGVTPEEVVDGDVSRKVISVQGDGNYYRYVRWERTPGSYSKLGYSGLAELEVYAFPENVKSEVITIDTPVYFAPAGIVKIPYTAENLAAPRTLTAYVAIKNTDGKLLAINTGNIELTVDAETSIAVPVDKNISDNIFVYVWEELTPVAGDKFQIQ